MDSTLSFWAKIKARHLESDVYAIVAFALIFLVSTYLYYYRPVRDEMFGEFQLAVSTSLLATIFISLVDFYTKYRNFEKVEFIENLYGFGIHNLYFNKQDVLERLIDEADTEIWISGYRLILTERIAEHLHNARKRGVSIRMLLCPPWSYTHELVYDDVEDSMGRYVNLLRMIVDNDYKNAGGVSIRFTPKPLFNDTYLCDHTIVTSPYMHNRDITHGVITAADFFTYEVDDGSKLFELLRNEYIVLYESAPCELPFEGARKALEEIEGKRRELSFLDMGDILTDHIAWVGAEGGRG